MFSTAEAAESIGVSKNTLLRWLAEGRLAEPARDWRNWRVWNADDLARARALRDRLHAGAADTPSEAPRPRSSGKPRVTPEYALDLRGLGAGRAFRRELPRPASPKLAVLPSYSHDLTRLDEGRRWRLQPEVGHGD